MGYRGTKYCTFHLLYIKNIPVFVVSASTGFIRLNYWYYTAGKFAGSNLLGCTIAFVVSKMKLSRLTWQGIHAQNNSWLGTNSYVLLCHQCLTIKEDHTCQSLGLLFGLMCLQLDFFIASFNHAVTHMLATNFSSFCNKIGVSCQMYVCVRMCCASINLV